MGLFSCSSISAPPLFAHPRCHAVVVSRHSSETPPLLASLETSVRFSWQATSYVCSAAEWSGVEWSRGEIERRRRGIKEKQNSLCFLKLPLWSASSILWCLHPEKTRRQSGLMGRNESTSDVVRYSNLNTIGMIVTLLLEDWSAVDCTIYKLQKDSWARNIFKKILNN